MGSRNYRCKYIYLTGPISFLGNVKKYQHCDNDTHKFRSSGNVCKKNKDRWKYSQSILGGKHVIKGGTYREVVIWVLVWHLVCLDGVVFQFRRWFSSVPEPHLTDNTAWSWTTWWGHDIHSRRVLQFREKHTPTIWHFPQRPPSS